MRVFFDTNILIAAFISHGACHEIFEHCISAHTSCVSETVVREFREKLAGKLKFPRSEVSGAVKFIREHLTVLKDPKDYERICRDPRDDVILAAAVAGGVDCMVTGDEDILVLRKFKGVPIIKPADFWRFEKG